MPPDSINISSLTLHLRRGLGPSAFHLSPPPPCPALLSLSINLIQDSVSTTAEGDSMVGLGVNYSAITKAVYALASDTEAEWEEPWQLMEAVSQIPLQLDDVESVNIRLGLPKALLHALEVVYEAKFTKDGQQFDRSCTIRDLKLVSIIGLHSYEQREKQRLELDIKIVGCDWKIWNHKGFADDAYNFVSDSTYGTIESLNHELGNHLLKSQYLGKHSKPHLSITVRKPSAIPFAMPSITIHRSQKDYPPTIGLTNKHEQTRVFVAVGSNIGDRVENILRAIRMLEENGCKLVDTSRLYESEPMYVEDQDRFVNGVLEVQTSLEPLELLRLLKRTEKTVGRVKTFTNGPRVIDLDLIFYGDQHIKLGEETDAEDEYGVRWLECPHKSLREREFVLRPLADIDPDFKHPSLKQSISLLLSKLPKVHPPALLPIIPLHGSASPLCLSVPSNPYTMAIFNATPDSFSDGDSARTNAKLALQSVENLLDSSYPPAILDIGGMSTRPGSEPCSEQEEISRVVPLIRAIRSSLNTPLSSIPISIDTYRSSVAKAAIEAGASMINDVRGGREPGMLKVMAEADVPLVLMHSRGDSKSMTKREMQIYSQHGGVVKGLQAEMLETVNKALLHGVKRWNIILDPGLGFAKSQTDSLSLLKHLASFKNPESELKDYPILVGGSRKGFVGATIGREVPTERTYGDAAVTAWCATSGIVDILRVHEPREMGEVIKMISAIQNA
ncbi:dihydropteroate synthase [Cryptococcus depauperatus CBS 7841]|uniref:Dihydropteroate synthase n=1 Tax=Cryptococcus depauperatus CBS 7841 TaxID=1295531 RepID=A0A1E3IN44_9TREE|nr:dihydropteroate synthase [Cryptococcus depauperatus CBS 7841]